jgi:hypothetical protein
MPRAAQSTKKVTSNAKGDPLTDAAKAEKKAAAAAARSARAGARGNLENNPPTTDGQQPPPAKTTLDERAKAPPGARTKATAQSTRGNVAPTGKGMNNKANDPSGNMAPHIAAAIGPQGPAKGKVSKPPAKAKALPAKKTTNGRIPASSTGGKADSEASRGQNGMVFVWTTRCFSANSHK